MFQSQRLTWIIQSTNTWVPVIYKPFAFCTNITYNISDNEQPSKHELESYKKIPLRKSCPVFLEKLRPKRFVFLLNLFSEESDHHDSFLTTQTGILHLSWLSPFSCPQLPNLWLLRRPITPLHPSHHALISTGLPQWLFLNPDTLITNSVSLDKFFTLSKSHYSHL